MRHIETAGPPRTLNAKLRYLELVVKVKGREQRFL